MSTLINPDQVEAKADSMESLTRNMRAKVEQVHSLAKSMKEVWQDTAQEDYEADFTKLSQGFESFAEAIPEFIQRARSHADLMRKVGKSC